MNLMQRFTQVSENWKSKLQADEWYFISFREQITTGLQPNEAFDLIPDGVEVVLGQNDEFLCWESFMLLMDLIRVSETTEMHPDLEANWIILCSHASQFGEHHSEQVSELKRWYRKDST
jgi:hypothetical protein